MQINAQNAALTQNSNGTNSLILFTCLSDHDESLLKENIHVYSDMYMHSLDSPVLALGSQGSHQPNPSVQLPDPQQAHTHMHGWMHRCLQWLARHWHRSNFTEVLRGFGEEKKFSKEP